MSDGSEGEPTSQTGSAPDQSQGKKKLHAQLRDLQHELSILKETGKVERRWQLIAGGLFLAFLGYTNVKSIPAEVGSQLTDRVSTEITRQAPLLVKPALDKWLEAYDGEAIISELDAARASARRAAFNAEEDAKRVALALQTAALPVGSVVAFDSQECPEAKGWFPFGPANGRVLIGAGSGSGLTSRRLREQKGREWVSLSEANLPSHSHSSGDLEVGNPKSLWLHESASGAAADSNRKWALFDDQTAYNLGNHQHSISGTTGETGDGEAFDIMPPFVALTFCVKKEFSR